MEETITITKAEYKSLLYAKVIADQLGQFIKQKATVNEGIYTPEVTTICSLYGITVE